MIICHISYSDQKDNNHDGNSSSDVRKQHDGDFVAVSELEITPKRNAITGIHTQNAKTAFIEFKFRNCD